MNLVRKAADIGPFEKLPAAYAGIRRPGTQSTSRYALNKLPVLNNGFSLKDVQEYMGHGNIQMTTYIYGHLDIQKKQLLTEKMAFSLFYYGVRKVLEKRKKSALCRRETRKGEKNLSEELSDK